MPVEIGRYDHRYGWSLIPGSVAVSSATGESIEYRINRLGLRGPEVEREPRSERYRVLLAGASRAFGYGVREEEHIPYLLEHYLDDTEVLNGGVSGYGLDQILLRFENEGRSLRPDLVLLYLPHFGNHRHMHSQRFGMRKPRFLLVNGKPMLESDLPDLGLRETPVWPTPFMATLERRSMLVQLFAHALTLRLGMQSDHWTSAAEYDEGERRDRENARDAEFMSEMEALAEALLVRFAHAVESIGAELLVVTEMRAFEQAASRHGIAALYLHHALNNPLYELDHGLRHLNAAGNAVLAAAVYEEITARRWLCDRHAAHHRCK